ncbi:BatD family protein [Winogradskyella sp.]|jgi:hypothetical protein|uniref:BatD family protein n=1 Tax=Winogradskyella sp. TaxID=1883156 RepID=UPI0025E4A1F3|nr:BatD family protein [Winogradskyella sp.]MCT4630530.1 BatD family protein [Winogradskyella sp.]
MKFLKNIAVITLLLVPILATAQVSFEAKLRKDKIGVNETVYVDFIMDKDSDSISFPAFKNFEIVSGPSKSISNTWVAGKRSYSKTFSYEIQPLQKGILEIEPASLVVDGIIYKTKVLHLKVVKKNRAKARADANIYKKVYLQLEYPKKKLTLRDTLEISYKLYISKGYAINKWGDVEQSTITNAVVKNVTPDSFQLKSIRIKGKDFRFFDYRKCKIVPLNKGDIKISPMTLETYVGVPTDKKDIFGKIIYEEKKITLSTEKVVIDVD